MTNSAAVRRLHLAQPSFLLTTNFLTTNLHVPSTAARAAIPRTKISSDNGGEYVSSLESMRNETNRAALIVALVMKSALSPVARNVPPSKFTCAVPVPTAN
jgi:hypothetical protein